MEKEIEWLCPDCDFENIPASRFCCKCGTSLLGDDSPANDQEASKSAQQPHPEAYTDTNSCEAPDSERKCVTVMFSDLTGYTEISEKLDPEDVKEITSRVFGKISRIVASYDGFIEKYASDAVMAIFGVSDHMVGNQSRDRNTVTSIHFSSPFF